jgi:hypothetical protein
MRIGSRNVPPYERDPSKLWLGTSRWYLDPTNFTLAFDDEICGVCTVGSMDPSVLLHTQLLTFGESTAEGRLVKSPTATWFEVCNQLIADPQFRFEFCTQSVKLEHFLAGRYCVGGWSDVTVTPRSGDKGRDVISVSTSERFLHEAKAYKASRKVTAEQVRALCYVKVRDPDATKAFITTTSDFAPGITDEFCEELRHILQIEDGEQFVTQAKCMSTAKSVSSLGSRLFATLGISTTIDANGHVTPVREIRPLQRRPGADG